VRIFATYNIKGGVGKTSAAVNLAHLAGQAGQRVLLWDLDPQGAATYIFRVRPRVKGGGKALVRGQRDLDAAIKGTDFDGLDLVPADFTYRNMDLQLDGTNGRLAGSGSCCGRWTMSTTSSFSIVRRAFRSCRKMCCTPPIRCWCR